MPNETGGQPIEQLGMGGGIALGAKVVAGGDQPSAKIVLPDAVDGDPSGEWVAGIENPTRQVETVSLCATRCKRSWTSGTS